jgi:hypothetical protein
MELSLALDDLDHRELVISVESRGILVEVLCLQIIIFCTVYHTVQGLVTNWYFMKSQPS